MSKSALLQHLSRRYTRHSTLSFSTDPPYSAHVAWPKQAEQLYVPPEVVAVLVTTIFVFQDLEEGNEGIGL